MWGEKEAQELRNGIHFVPPFAFHWHALSARERYLMLKILAESSPVGREPASSARFTFPRPAAGELFASMFDVGRSMVAIPNASASATSPDSSPRTSMPLSAGSW
jgi:hypothetical protein